MQEFDKRMWDLGVFVTESGGIYITQKVIGLDTQEIVLDPAQIDVLIEWLKEAKTKL